MDFLKKGEEMMKNQQMGGNSNSQNQQAQGRAAQQGNMGNNQNQDYVDKGLYFPSLPTFTLSLFYLVWLDVRSGEMCADVM
jgi:hypothetical protein